MQTTWPASAGNLYPLDFTHFSENHIHQFGGPDLLHKQTADRLCVDGKSGFRGEQGILLGVYRAKRSGWWRRCIDPRESYEVAVMSWVPRVCRHLVRCTTMRYDAMREEAVDELECAGAVSSGAPRQMNPLNRSVNARLEW